MKLAVFDAFRIGLVEDGSVYDVTSALPDSLADFPHQRVNWLIEHWPALAPRLSAARAEARARPLSQVALLAASPTPAHVFAAPANYRKHIGEMGARAVSKGRSAREQGFFLKAPGSLVGAGGAIALPRGSRRRFDHEAELAIVVGRRGRNVSRAEALEHVFGYACLIDVTMRIERDVAEEERSMRKSFTSFTPLGPFLVTADEVPDPQALTSRLWVNDELRQEANTRDMIVGVAELIEMISSVLDIRPGDVIATGTPEGVGALAPGDRVRIAIERVGDMTLPVTETDQVSVRTFQA